MVENVAVQYELANITLVAGTQEDCVIWFYENGVFPHAFESLILLVYFSICCIICRTIVRVPTICFTTDILSFGVEDFDDFKRVHMNVERMGA